MRKYPEPPKVIACSLDARGNTQMRVRDGKLVCEGGRRFPAKQFAIEDLGMRDLVLNPPVGSYTTASEPCKSKRKGCPVQLVFKDSKPFVRFCRRAGNGKPGWLVAAKSPDHARELVGKACAQWKRTRSFTSSNPAVVEAGGTLGRFRR